MYIFCTLILLFCNVCGEINQPTNKQTINTFFYCDCHVFWGQKSGEIKAKYFFPGVPDGSSRWNICSEGHCPPRKKKPNVYHCPCPKLNCYIECSFAGTLEQYGVHADQQSHIRDFNIPFDVITLCVGNVRAVSFESRK